MEDKLGKEHLPRLSWEASINGKTDLLAQSEALEADSDGLLEGRFYSSSKEN